MANTVVDFKQVDNDLYFDTVKGDFIFTPSDNQHILDICVSCPGWWKNAPQMGANLPQLLKSKLNVSLVENTLKAQLEADMFQVVRPVIIKNGNNYTINPNASRL